jgi:hypothetical protein
MFLHFFKITKSMINYHLNVPICGAIDASNEEIFDSKLANDKKCRLVL